MNINAKTFVKKLFFWILALVILSSAYLVLRTNTKNVHVVSRGNVRSFLSATGKLDAENKAELSFKTTGKVAEVKVEEGNQVEKNSVLARLDTRELNLSLARAQDDLRQAEAELAKVYDEVKGHENDESYAQRQSRTQAEVKRDKAVKSVESAKKALSDSALYSPFDGTVINLNLEVNEWVSAFSLEPQIIVVDPTTVYFSAEVDQEDIGGVKAGQKAKVSFDAYRGRDFEGVVYQIARTTRETDGGNIVEVKVKLESLPDFIIGLDGDTEITLMEKSNVLLIPKDAVYKKDGESFVKTGSGEKKVKLGIFDGSNWEVVEGLQDGEKIKW